jgi:hypothetical protein
MVNKDALHENISGAIGIHQDHQGNIRRQWLLITQRVTLYKKKEKVFEGTNIEAMSLLELLIATKNIA